MTDDTSSSAPFFHAFVGCSSGLLKGIKVTKKTLVQQNLEKVSSVTENDVVTAMSWGDEEERKVLLGCGIKENKSYKIYDTHSCNFVTKKTCDVGKGIIVGISRYDEKIMTAAESGHVKVWEDSNETLLINAGDGLQKMRKSLHENVIGTGGEENPLKLYNLETGQQIFIAKNVPHDHLELRVPISVKDIGFFSTDSEVATVGKYGHVRLYDPKAQRRPVVKIDVKDESLSALAIRPKEKQIIVGSGKGRMNLIDLRKPGKILNTYKGSVGGITSILCSETNPYIVSVGLDRFLRVHHIQTKEEIKKVYLMSKAKCLLLRPDFSLEDDDKNENTDIMLRDKLANEQKDEDQHLEYEKLFNNMEKIEDQKESLKKPKTVKKRQIIKEKSINEQKAFKKTKRTVQYKAGITL